MFILSKIISKEWFKSLFGSILVLFLLITIGDIINGFLRNIPFQQIIIEYLLKLPEFGSRMLPIAALLASLFSINKLKTHSELMAILAGGYSAQKIFTLVLACSFSLAAFQYLNLGYILPQANKVKRQINEKSRKNESKYLARSSIGKEGLIWYKTDQYFTSFKAFDTKNNLLKDVTIYFLDKNSLLDSIYKAKSAKYISKQKWLLKDISIIQSLATNGFQTETNADQLFLELSEEPQDFSQFESDITTLNIIELNQFITRLESTDINSTEYRVMFYDKIAFSITCIVFALFPLSGIFNPNRRAAGFGKSIVTTLIFSIGFFAMHSGFLSLANVNKIPVFIATLGAPFLCASYIFINFLRNRTL